MKPQGTPILQSLWKRWVWVLGQSSKSSLQFPSNHGMAHCGKRVYFSQVLNMVCEDCGKPCRNKTQQDLHSKHTGHTKFVDKVPNSFWRMLRTRPLTFN